MAGTLERRAARSRRPLAATLVHRLRAGFGMLGYNEVANKLDEVHVAAVDLIARPREQRVNAIIKQRGREVAGYKLHL